MYFAAAAGHADVLSLLLAHKSVDPTVGDDAPLRAAVEGGHLAAVEVLLADGRPDPASSNNHCLLWAGRSGDWDVAQALYADERVQGGEWCPAFEHFENEGY